MVAAQLSEFDPLVLKELEDKSRGKLAELNKSGRVIGEEIFKILDQTALLIQYPIDDDELCGFVCKKDNRIFAFVNSAIPLEKQMFAAAHELYHIWYDEAALGLKQRRIVLRQCFWCRSSWSMLNLAIWRLIRRNNWNCRI